MDFLYHKYKPLYKILYPDIINLIYGFIGEDDMYDEHIDFIDDEILIPKSQYNRLYHSKYKYCLYNIRAGK